MNWVYLEEFWPAESKLLHFQNLVRNSFCYLPVVNFSKVCQNLFREVYRLLIEEWKISQTVFEDPKEITKLSLNNYKLWRSRWNFFHSDFLCCEFESIGATHSIEMFLTLEP